MNYSRYSFRGFRSCLLIIFTSVLVLACSSEKNRDLVIAASDGNVKTIETLLANGANIESYALDGLTPLMAAAKNGRMEAVVLLINKGAKPNAIPDGSCCTPLQFAAFNGNIEIVRFLLTHEGRINGTQESNAYLLRNIHEKNYVEIEHLIQQQIEHEGKSSAK